MAEDLGRIFEGKDEVFGAALDAQAAEIFDLGKAGRNWLAEVGTVLDDARNDLPFEPRGDAKAGGFDFGEFRHEDWREKW